MNHIENLKSTKIWKRLNDLDSGYANKSVTFLQQIIPLLDSVIDYFPFYTRHDAIHGFNVLKRMAEIVKPACIEGGDKNDLSFSRSELFLLICSAYAHDLGMTIFPNEERELLELLQIKKINGWKTDTKLQKYLRETHSKRGGKYISENYEKLNVPMPLTGFLDKMMKAHNMDINQLESELEEIPLDSKSSDLKQLACVLCTADALEFSDTRVIDGVIDRTKNGTTAELIISFRENMKHESIGNCLSISDGGIKFAGSFNDPHVLNLTYKTIDEIELWLKEYKYIDNKCRNQILNINPFNIQTNFISQGFDFERIGVQLNKDNILKLISSDSMWQNNPKAVIKELLQNSIEACRYRRSRTLPFQDYNANIKLKFNSQNNTIMIEDNGCGMSRHTIRSNFLTVGNSRSFDTTYSNGHDSLARFGIGFWSVFTIANNAIIQTAPFELLKLDDNSGKVCLGVKFEVSIDELKDYTVFTEKKIQAGTTIEMLIKDEHQQDFFNLVEWVKSFLICSDISISIFINEDEYIIPKYIKSPSLKELIKIDPLDPGGKKEQELIDNELSIFEWGAEKTATDNLNVSFSIIYRKDTDGNITFMKKNENWSLSQWGYLESKYFSGVCGFNVNYASTLTFPSNYFKSSLINVSNPKGLQFDLHRNTLLDTTERKKLISDKAKLEFEAITEFLNTTNSNNPKDIFHLNRQASMPSNDSFYDYSTKEGMEIYSSLICYRIYKISKNNHGEFTYQENYVRFNDLLNFETPIYFYNTSLNKGPMVSFRYPNTFCNGTSSTREGNKKDGMLPIIANAMLTSLFNQLKVTEVNLIDFNKDAAILYENCPNVEIHLTGEINPVLDPSSNRPLFFSSYDENLSFKNGYIQIFEIQPGSVNFNNEKPSKIFNHKKANSNAYIVIFENKINSPGNKTQFFFLDHSDKIIINKDCSLLIIIKELILTKKINEIVDLIALLKAADSGNVDEKVRVYCG